MRDPSTRSLVWRAVASVEKSDATKIEGSHPARWAGGDVVTNMESSHTYPNLRAGTRPDGRHPTTMATAWQSRRRAAGHARSANRSRGQTPQFDALPGLRTPGSSLLATMAAARQ